MISTIGKLFRNDEGLAAIEFSTVLPMFVTLFLGSFTAFEMYVQRDNIQNSTNVLSDLISRQLDVDDNFLAIQHGLHMSLNGVRNPDDAPLVVTSVQNFLINANDPNDPTDDVTENRAVWRYDSRSGQSEEITTTDPYTAYALPMLAPGETVIIVEATVTDSPIFDYFGFGRTDYENVAVLTPRYTNRIVNCELISC